MTISFYSSSNRVEYAVFLSQFLFLYKLCICSPSPFISFSFLSSQTIQGRLGIKATQPFSHSPQTKQHHHLHISFIMNYTGSKSFSVVFSTARQIIYHTSRSISHYTWKGKPPYKSGSPERQKCVNYAFAAAKDLGFDAHGAVVGEIA